MELKQAVLDLKSVTNEADAIIERQEIMLSQSSASVESRNHSRLLQSIVEGDVSLEPTEETIKDLTEIVVTLVSRIDELERENESLLSDQEPEDVEKREESLLTFRKAIREASILDLINYYTESVLAKFSSDTREAIANELIRHANDLKKQPASIWLTLANNNGNF